jgi:hypothetical protein
MSFSSLRIGTLGASALLGLLLIPTSATGQPEDEVLMRPVPAGVFSESIVTVAYIPLDDVAQALGARLQFDSNQNTYTAQPGETGVLRINPEHVMGIVIEEHPSLEIGQDRMGVVIEDRPAPEGDAERLAQTARLDAVHQPAAARLVTGEPGTPKARPATFEIEGNLVSRGIIIIDNRPYMPLEDFAAAIGVGLEERPGRSGLIYMFNMQPEPPDPNASPLLELSRRGRSLIEGREP